MKKLFIFVLLILWAAPSWGMTVYYNAVDGRIYYAVPANRVVNFSHTTNLALSTLEIDERRLDGSNETETINLSLRKARCGRLIKTG